jgi:hypothetical protein
MKGVIFNFLEEFILDHLGKEKYEKILNDSPLVTREAFVGPGLYPDEDLISILARTAEEMGIGTVEALRLFGRFCFPALANRFPEFTAPYTHPKPFLMIIDSTIHMEVEKLYPGTETPSLAYEDSTPDRLILRYKSKRKLCQFLEGMIDGVADHFNSPISHKQVRCMLDGEEACKFELDFASEGGAVR